MSERPKIVLLVLGGLVTFVMLAVLTAGIALLGATRDEAGYVTTPLVRYTTPAYALVSETVDMSGTAEAFAWLQMPGNPASIRVRARSESGKPIFVGIAADADVQDFLAGVPHAVLRGGRAAATDRSGVKAPARPGERRFWEAAASGPATQTLAWTARPGRWAIVVMNDDATPLVDASLATGFRAVWLTALARVLAAVGAIGLLAGLLLIVYGGMIPSEIAAPGAAGFPVAIEGHLTEPLSRWLWLVKWLLAFPHAVILFFLWIAFAVLTVAAFFAILIAGRYPAPLFATNVGILRWSWRVGFYAYSALGTDRYPPFTLRDADYPARLTVAYPQQLSRGLALVKWWLLAIPHYLIIGIFSGTWWSTDDSNGGGAAFRSRGGLLPLLVFFAGIALAFTGRYPRGLFDLIVGLHRWVFRVVTYAALMHDVYPPFRVDLGGEEPGPRGLQTITAS